MNTRTHPPVPCAECGSRGKMVEDDDGFTVVCANPHCDGIPPLAINEATLTRRAAWEYWGYKNKAPKEAA